MEESQQPELFPLLFWSYAVAPLWQGFNTTTGGAVRWKIYDSSNHSEELASVDTLIEAEAGNAMFVGLWMLVASWEDVTYLDNDTYVSKLLLSKLRAHLHNCCFILYYRLHPSKPY